MTQPIILAHHLLLTAYGWWLPNDPRGSGSKEIRSEVIEELGEIHHGRKRIQPGGSAIRAFYQDAAPLLKHPLLVFDEGDRAVIAEAFADVVAQNRYTCYACAIMPDHMHILIRKHKHEAEDMLDALKTASRDRLRAAGRRPADHPVWTHSLGWKVFLDHPDDIRRTIPYIERNPLPLHLAVQRWPFVVLYDGWPFHEGHNPNSPYARRLRAVGRYPVG